jgi:hypothetical protein
MQSSILWGSAITWACLSTIAVAVTSTVASALQLPEQQQSPTSVEFGFTLLEYKKELLVGKLTMYADALRWTSVEDRSGAPASVELECANMKNIRLGILRRKYLMDRMRGCVRVKTTTGVEYTFAPQNWNDTKPFQQRLQSFCSSKK